MGESADPRSEWLAVQSLADASGYDYTVGSLEPACSRMRLAIFVGAPVLRVVNQYAALSAALGPSARKPNALASGCAVAAGILAAVQCGCR